MDHRKLVDVVKQYPQIWDRNFPLFRDKDVKEEAWSEIARIMNVAVDFCKDTFKSLREKYLREREKAHREEYYKPWELLSDFRFLDPHILTRTAAWSGSLTGKIDNMSVNPDTDPTDFDTHLISLVKESSSIWDRNSNTYPNKTSKGQLWEQIGITLNRDVNTCMLRWKALREKYIRQRAKFQEGDAKWELLDNLSFLDKVIQYRKKQFDFKLHLNDNVSISSTYSSETHNENSSCGDSAGHIRENITDDNLNADSSNDFLNIIKEETIVQRVADSSYNSINIKRSRQNSIDSSSDMRYNKKLKTGEISQIVKVTEDKIGDIKEKSPEQLFGELVASLLSKKPENQRNLYMIEIMTILSK